MRWYIGDFNGMLHDLSTKLGDKITTPREADVWITFQDCQGSYADLIKASKSFFPKPVYVVQHGRAATLDYAAPNSFPLLADKFFCWGSSDYDRLCSLGYKDRAVISGCPLNVHIKPRIEHKEKNILFVPVNTGKEEPENIAVYYELLKLKYEKAQIRVLNSKGPLKDKWGFNGSLNVSFNQLAQDFEVTAKLLPWHDKSLYHGNCLLGYQDTFKNNQLNFNLLRNVDLVVGLDEGTTEVFAYGHDVPVITVDGFKYRQHNKDGRRYTTVDTYKTPASTHVELKDLGAAIDYALAHPEHKRAERKAVAESELGISYGNATENIYKFIRNDMKASCRS